MDGWMELFKNHSFPHGPTLVWPWSCQVGHLQPFYLFLSRLGCSLGELQDVWPDKFCQAKHPEDQNPASIYGQDMELLMTDSHMHLQDIKSSPNLLPRTATEVCLPSS